MTMKTSARSSIIPATLTAIGSTLLITMLMKRCRAKVKEPAPSKLRVYGFMQLPPDPDSSPACTKLLTFLKMTKTEYDYVPFTVHQFKESPLGKVPWAHGAVLGEESLVADSSFIMDALVRADPAKYDLDAHLTKEEHAIGTFIKSMLEESCYFTAVLHVRWNTDEMKRCTVPCYLATLPALLRGIVAKHIQKKLLLDLKGQGSGLLDDKQVIIKAEKEIRALSDFLGSKKYLLGDKISSFDATAYAFAAAMIQGDWNHPITEIARECSNIVNYVERMRKEFWPELPDSTSSEKS